MNFGKLWQRHLFQRLLKTFSLFLVSLFIVYVLIDLSVNSVRFFSLGNADAAEISLYYARKFAKHLGLFFPLGFLLSSLKVLFDLNLHKELVALQMAGLSKKKLLSPFFFFAFLLSACSYANEQWIAPQAQDAADAFRAAHAKRKKQNFERLFTPFLEDGTELVYRRFDSKEKRLSDVYWIRSNEDVWHMKYLEIDPPRALFADHFQRRGPLRLDKTESFEEKPLPDLRWEEEENLYKFVPLENRPLSELFQKAPSASVSRPGLLSQLHYKLALPLIPFLVLFGISPFALRFSRNLSAFLAAACGLFSLVALMTLLDGMLILAEGQILPPLLAIWGPLLLLFLALFRPFLKLK